VTAALRRFAAVGGAGFVGGHFVVRLNAERIRSLGWKNDRTCEEALRDSVAAMPIDARAGRFDT
jgi:UDP-glucose 4-epimerase